MADLLAQGAAWLEGQRIKHMASAATYSRGASSAPVMATPDSTDVEQTDAGGYAIQSEIRDFLINVAELILDDAATEPAVGDVIEMTMGGVAQRYMVIQVGDEVWRYGDPYRNRFRVHVRRVGSS